MSTVWIYRSPAQLLDDLGISEPGDLRIEAIAQYCRATVRYKQLEGCEARLIGFGDRAIIAVNKVSRRERQRFSVGHELGHWMRDHAKVAFTAFSCSEKAFLSEWSGDNPERRANRYATELLLPEAMFRQRAKNREITFSTVRELAKQFQMSLTATAIRLVELGSFPSAVVCNERNNRRWFFVDSDVPKVLRLRDEPGRDTLAYDLLRNGEPIYGPVDVYADSWIDHEDAGRYSLREDSIKITLPDNTRYVLSLLWWKDEKQLLDLEEDS